MSKSEDTQDPDRKLKYLFRVWIGSYPLESTLDYLAKDKESNPDIEVSLVYDSYFLSPKERNTLKKEAKIKVLD